MIIKTLPLSISQDVVISSITDFHVDYVDAGKKSSILSCQLYRVHLQALSAVIRFDSKQKQGSKIEYFSRSETMRFLSIASNYRAMLKEQLSFSNFIKFPS